MYVCMYMYVRNRFTTEVYKFTYSVRTLWHVPVLELTILRGETTTPGQRTRPEVQKTFKR